MIVTRSSSRARGVSAVMMVRITFCSCSTLLCLRLCSSAVGANSGSLVRNTAVPGTMCGGFFSRLCSSASSGTSVLRVLLARMRVPRRQVRISITMEMPNSSGTQAPSSSLSRLAEKNVASTIDQRHHQQRRLPDRPLPQLPDHDEAQHAVDHHGGGDRDAVGGGERARGVEQADQQQHADQQRGVDARQIDLPGIFRRGVHDGEPRQQAELDRLPHQRIGAGDDGLAGDHGGGGGQHDQRQQQRFGHQAIERILDRRRDAPAPARPARNS